MRQTIFQSAGLLTLGTVAFIGILLSLPGDRSVAADAYFLFLGAILLLALVRLTKGVARADTLSFDRLAEGRPVEEEQLPELARMERNVVLATAKQFDSRQRIRPILREIAEHRLATNRGIFMDDDPDRAREALGEEAWDLIHFDQDESDRRRGRGLELERLERAVDSLENI
ncbi:MAG TPA: hypothetical protein VF895_11115 [Gaiellaceae bacterium]